MYSLKLHHRRNRFTEDANALEAEYFSAPHLSVAGLTLFTASKGQKLLGRMAARAATAHAPRIPLRSLGPDSISDLTLRFRTPSGGLLWTSFKLGNLHMFLDILKLRVENKKKRLKKTVLIIRSQSFGKMP